MRILSFSELRPVKGIPYCRDHIRRLVNACQFPKPIKLGTRLAWFEHEIDQWIVDRMAERDKHENAAA